MKKKLSIIITALILSILAAGCSVEIHEDSGKQDAKYYLYDISSDETQLQKESYSPESEWLRFCSICLIKKISKTAKPSFFVFVGKWHVKCVQNLHMMHTKKGKRIWKQQKKSEK